MWQVEQELRNSSDPTNAQQIEKVISRGLSLGQLHPEAGTHPFIHVASTIFEKWWVVFAGISCLCRNMNVKGTEVTNDY